MKNDEIGLKFFNFIRESTSLKTLYIKLLSSPYPVTIPKGSIPHSVENLKLIFANNHVEIQDNNFDEVEDFNQMRMTLKEDTIPNSVKKLEIDHLFLKWKPKVIPDSVENLLIYYWCEDSIFDQYNDKVDSDNDNGDILDILSSVKYLAIDKSWDEERVDIFKIPENVIDIKLSDIIEIGPLRRKKIPQSVNSSSEVSQNFSAVFLPSSLETLDLLQWEDPTQILIPPSVKFIKLWKFN
eukprot:gene5490-6840_t